MQEYQETINTWKEYPHVMTMLTKSRYDVPQKPFLQKFLEGTPCIDKPAHDSDHV